MPTQVGATTPELLISAGTIKAETVPGANTALRLGKMFEDIINSTPGAGVLMYKIRFPNTAGIGVDRYYFNSLIFGNQAGTGDYILVEYIQYGTGDFGLRIKTNYVNTSPENPSSFTRNISNGYSYEISFSDAKVRLDPGWTNASVFELGRYAYYTEFRFKCYNTSGVLANVLGGTNLTITYWPW